MKITIEIDEAKLAAVWADATWHGKYPQTIEQIMQGLVGDAYSTLWPYSKDRAATELAQFRAAHGLTIDNIKNPA